MSFQKAREPCLPFNVVRVFLVGHGPYFEARGVELFTEEYVLHSGSRAVRGWEHMPLTNCRIPSTLNVAFAEHPEEDTSASPTLAPRVYTALVRSVLLPWGRQHPGETHSLRVGAAAALRDALGVSAEQHATALILARRANKALVRELKVRLSHDGGYAAEARDDSSDDDLAAASLLQIEKPSLERLVLDLCALPRFDANIQIGVLKVESQSPSKPKPEPTPKPKVEESKPKLLQKSNVGIHQSHSADVGVGTQNVALVDSDVNLGKRGGGLFACCFQGSVTKAHRVHEPAQMIADAPPPAVDNAPAPAPAVETEPFEEEDNGTDLETRTQGQLYCTLSMRSGAGDFEAAGGYTYSSSRVQCTPCGDTMLRACSPQMRVCGEEAATASIKVSVYWVGVAQDEVHTDKRDGDSEPISERLAMAVEAGDGSAEVMRTIDIHNGQREGILVGMASIRVADLQDTSECPAPLVKRVELHAPNNRSSAGSQDTLPHPDFIAVHIAADCLVESFHDADERTDNSGDTNRVKVESEDTLAEDEIAESCRLAVSALWAGWERSGYIDSGGPLDAPLRAGMHVPTWSDTDACDITGTSNTPRRRLLPPDGWQGVICAFAALHRVSRATLALAEAEAIARRWHSEPDVTVISALHARLAVAVSAISSGRASTREASLHANVAAVILPRAENLLHRLLAPALGSDVSEAVMALHALTPVLALCFPLDTPAPSFANYLQCAARKAVLARIAKDLTTPLPDEPKIMAEAASDARLAVVGVVKDYASEYDVGSYSGVDCDMSNVAFSQNGTEGGPVASVKARFVPMSKAAVAAVTSSEILTLSRVTGAVKTAVACFPADMTMYHALPPGVSAAHVALHSAAAALMCAAEEVIVSAGRSWELPYGTAFATLDGELRRFRRMMHKIGLGSAAGPLKVGKLDDLLRQSLEELLASIRPRLASILQRSVSRERSPTLPPTPVAPTRGAMHSASLVDLFATLRDTYIAAMPASVRSQHLIHHHTTEVESMIGAALRWYAREYERDCLAEVRTARRRLWEKRVESRFTNNRKHPIGNATGAGGRYNNEESDGRVIGDGMNVGPHAALSFGFQTRLSNIHACVESLRALREDCPMLWQAGNSSFSSAKEYRNHTANNFNEDNYDERSDDDGEEMEDNEEGEYLDRLRNNDMKSYVGAQQKSRRGSDVGLISESITFVELLRFLRCSRASVISAATELLMDIVTPDLTMAIMSSAPETRHAAMSRAFECINAELALMDSALSAGAFRLAAAAIHRATCAVLERLVLHRTHDDVRAHASGGTSAGVPYTMSGGSLSATPAPLTEAQHSRVVELTDTLRDFLSGNGGGVPLQVLMDGEQRLRRLLNLWFTPTVEVVREYWRQMDDIANVGGGAAAAIRSCNGAAGVVRPGEGGGVGPLDLIQLLLQRNGMSGDSEATVLIDAQLSTTADVNAQAVLGLRPGEPVIASFVCRFDETTLAGRLFITPSCVGFSPCGVGPDHPHDMHSAVTAPLNNVLRALRGDADTYASSSSTSLELLLVDSRELRFDYFAGGARARDRALEALRSSAATHHPQAPFMVASGAISLSPTNQDPDSKQDQSNIIVLPPGEKSRQKFACSRIALQDEPGTLLVTSAALMWLADSGGSLNSSGVGLRIQHEDINLASITMSRLGWTDHMVTVGLKPKPGFEASSIRFIRLTESGARALQGELRAAATVAADSSVSVF